MPMHTFEDSNRQLPLIQVGVVSENAGFHDLAPIVAHLYPKQKTLSGTHARMTSICFQYAQLWVSRGMLILDRRYGFSAHQSSV